MKLKSISFPLHFGTEPQTCCNNSEGRTNEPLYIKSHAGFRGYNQRGASPKFPGEIPYASTAVKPGKLGEVPLNQK